MTTKNTLLQSALWYRKLGFSVIPQGRDKKPLINWTKYQEEHPSEQEIEQWWTQYPDAMIAIVTGKISDITVIDVDSRKGLEIMLDLLPDKFSTPVVISPSGGKHLYFKYCPGLVTRSRDLEDIDTKTDGGLITAPPSINENDKQYKWADGYHIKNMPLAELPQAYIQAVKKGTDPFTCNDNRHSITVSFNKGNRDESLFHAAHSLVLGGMSQENIEKVILHLAKSCDPPFSNKEAKEKINSAIQRALSKDRNLTQEVRDWINLSWGWFSLPQIYESLAFSVEDKANVRKILSRLRQEKVIETSQTKYGWYRLPDMDCEQIDWRKSSGTPLDIKYPFEIEKMVNTYSKNIIVIAGEPNYGKTAFLFNFIKLNMDKHDIHYFSSESGTGGDELKIRLSKFTDIKEEDWKFTAWERSSNFSDVIKPDSINVVDFLEIVDEFWRVGEYIKLIYDKLNKGIAFVAIQKNMGRELGRGGGLGTEKPRLYLALGRDPETHENKIKIIKGKNWSGKQNPNYQALRFKIINGAQLMPTSYWCYESPQGSRELF